MSKEKKLQLRNSTAEVLTFTNQAGGNLDNFTIGRCETLQLDDVKLYNWTEAGFTFVPYE